MQTSDNGDTWYFPHEKMPDPDEQVLAYSLLYKGVGIGYYKDDPDQWFFNFIHAPRDPQILLWRYKPEPPAELLSLAAAAAVVDKQSSLN
jgi:hypothetical protein